MVVTESFEILMKVESSGPRKCRDTCTFRCVHNILGHSEPGGPMGYMIPWLRTCDLNGNQAGEHVAGELRHSHGGSVLKYLFLGHPRLNLLLFFNLWSDH